MAAGHPHLWIVPNPKRLIADQARANADECRAFARSEQLIDHRAVFEGLAQSWDRIAEAMHAPPMSTSADLKATAELQMRRVPRAPKKPASSDGDEATRF
jgi:hypothetical protein